MNSPTYGTVSMDEIAAIIKSKVENDSGEFNIMIGTDSQNFHETKMVIVIALHHVGHGGLFFYEESTVRRITNVKEKLLHETSLSLEYAQQLLDAFDRLKEDTGFDYQKHVNFSIHVDAGYNGPSSQAIPDVVGWIKACGYEAVIKPTSYAACSIANKYSKPYPAMDKAS